MYATCSQSKLCTAKNTKLYTYVGKLKALDKTTVQPLLHSEPGVSWSVISGIVLHTPSCTWWAIDYANINIVRVVLIKGDILSGVSYC